MNKIFILTAIIFSLFFAQDSFAKVKKIKCNKPIYFFENVNKREYFYYLDESLQNQYELKKYYPELGFISFNYEVKRNKPEIVALNLKQFGRDVFLFIDISKSNTKLEQKIYEDLKKHSTNSYLIRDDYFCKELTKDVNLINTKRKNHITDTPNKNPAVYEFDIKRYVGYNKKTYFWKKKNKKEKKKKEKI